MEWNWLTVILKRESIMARAIGILLIASLLGPSSGCDFPAVYNFGDSNSDTGSVSAAFGRLASPSGETFFRKPSGRYSDGRLIIDFIAEKLGLPFLSAYLDAIESNFRHGANFASSGSTIQPVDGKLFGAGINPLSLSVQLLQFEQLKDRTKELYAEGQSSEITIRLPKPEEFSKALYTLDIGQNDLYYGFKTTTVEQVNASIPNLITLFSQNIKTLYQEGARTFWIHNTGPIGCLPMFVGPSPPKPEDADPVGCVKSYNEVAQEFNKQLKEEVSQLRTKLPDARLVFVDIYSAKYTLISNANKYGFFGPFATCSSCSDPSKYISWDGTHYTEAANYWVANRILNGSLSDPPVPIAGACH